MAGEGAGEFRQAGFVGYGKQGGGDFSVACQHFVSDCTLRELFNFLFKLPLATPSS
jgi:hypothetical protein